MKHTNPNMSSQRVIVAVVCPTVGTDPSKKRVKRR